MESLVARGVRILVPEIADYEVRRELLRARKARGIARLNLLKEALGYLPLSTPVMPGAAQFWAEARNQGKPTADDTSLDGDMILAAQAASLEADRGEVVVATTNPRHLELFVTARHWADIQ
jgi:predicted nucleic acid-binding protein